MPCPSFCPNCSSSLTCLSCPYGSYLQNGNCTQCSLTNCISCDTIGPNVCTLCNIGYYLVNNTCKNCISNCSVCLNGSTCEACSDGFYLTSTGNCQPCIKNCAICQASNSCSQCSVRYYAKAGLCYQCPN